MSMGEVGRGRFITIEGTDGAGKSTQLGFIRHYLESRGIDCVVTREPGGTGVGEAIRELLLDHVDLHITPRTQLLLVFAARMQHIDEVIEPALARGEWVLCDRFTDATYAYQGSTPEVGFAAVEVIEDWVQGTLQPDLTLLFDVEVEIGIARTRSRGVERDRFEGLDCGVKQRIREAYLQLASAHPQRIVVVDGSRAVEQVNAEVAAVLSARIARWAER